MKKISIFLISALLVVLQVTITSHFKFFGLNYGFALVSVIVVACIFDKQTSIVNALVCGIFFDTFASSHYGTYLTVFLIAALLTVFISEFMYKGSLVTSLVVTFILTFLSELILYYIFIASQGGTYHSYVLTRVVLPQSLINAFISIIVFGIYKSLYKKLKLDKQW